MTRLDVGGMGEVYRARDTTLNRDIAIKSLPDVAAHDTDRIARFAREAQTPATLNHPNIARIYGVVEEPQNGAHVRKDGQRFIVVRRTIEPGRSRQQLNLVVNWIGQLRRVARAK